MTAIIKNRFRIQNAKDFLENFKNHPRMLEGQPAPLINDITITSVNGSTKIASAKLDYSWTLDTRITDFSSSNNNTQVRADAIRGLVTASGAHIQDRNHYLFIGKALPWGTTQSELVPPLPQDTFLEEKEVWHEMLSLKKISELDASLVIRRFDWDQSKKTVYVPFDDKDPNLYRHPTPQESIQAQALNRYAGAFYCLNDEYQLFICLENGGNSPSTHKPILGATATDLVDNREFDGYVWKYITTIKPSDVAKFLTDSWIPVKTLGNIPNDSSGQWLVEQNAVPGQVLSFIVDNQGSNYTKVHAGQIGTATNVAGNTVVTLLAVSGGTAPSTEDDFYNGAALYVTEGLGAGSMYDIIGYVTPGANREATLSGSVQIDNTSKYVIAPKMVIESDSTIPITARPVVVDGKITAVRITNRGENATFVNVSIVANSAQTLGGVQARVRAVLGPIEGLGKDPEKDLGAFYVMLNAKLTYKEGSGDFPIDNDYRQIGIIRDVRNPDNTLATATTLNATKLLKLYNITSGTFTPDEKFLISTDSGTTWQEGGRVLEYAESQTESGVAFLAVYKQLGVAANLSSVTNLLVRGVDSGAQASVSLITSEEVKKFHGQILYLENRRPILRAPDQIEDIKAIVEF